MDRGFQREKKEESSETTKIKIDRNNTHHSLNALSHTSQATHLKFCFVFNFADSVRHRSRTTERINNEKLELDIFSPK